MILNGVRIEDTFAEAFGMRGTRILITADHARWARTAAVSMTGFATSVIDCGCEAGIERDLDPSETPDGRPGVSVLMFSMGSKDLQKQLARRVGQCVLTAAGTACFSGLQAAETLGLGDQLRYFGDGHQIAKRLGRRRWWRIPVMDGEFVVESQVGMVRAVGGGNLLIVAASRHAALAATEAAVEAIRRLPNVVMPFPGGIVRSGSKVGAKYEGMIASTNDPYCPTLKHLAQSALPPEAEAVLEIVIDGLGEEDVAAAMRAGMRAACARGAGEGVIAITAGNYGGKLGKFHFHLHELMGAGATPDGQAPAP